MEEHPVQGEKEFPGTYLLWSSLFSSSFGNSLAQSGDRWSNLHRHVFDRCGVLCSLVPFHFIKCPEFGFQGYVLGQIIFNLGLWDWIAHPGTPASSFGVRPQHRRCITRARLAPFLAPASLAAIRSPHVTHAALFGYLGTVIL